MTSGFSSASVGRCLAPACGRACVPVLLLAFAALTGCGAAGDDESEHSSAIGVARSELSLRERAPHGKPAASLLGAAHSHGSIVVKFAEGSHVRHRDGKLAADPADIGADDALRLGRSGIARADVRRLLSDVQGSIGSLPGTALRRLFTRPDDELEREQREGERLSGHELADLNLYYRINLPGLPGSAVDALLDELNASPLVELAYAPSAVVHPTDIPPTTQSFVGTQTYLGPAPGGLDVNYAWTVTGGNGAGVRIIDVEAGWTLTHEDLPSMFVKLGTNFSTDPEYVQHGTSVLGILGALKNAYGVTGIANGATIGVSSELDATSDDAAGVALGINTAVARLAPGDVVLIEASAEGIASNVTCPCDCVSTNLETQFETLPVEWDQPAFDAIQAATARNIVVVEPAGNGSMDLDASRYNHVFDRTSRDSGAVMVGGAMSATHVPHCRTNYGARLDVSSWAENIMTTGNNVAPVSYTPNMNYQINGADQNQWYRNSFTGTSGASAMIAAVAADVQGSRLAQLMGPYSSYEMRFILGFAGQAQPTPVTKKIGPMPNLRTTLDPSISTTLPYEPSANGNVAVTRQSANITSAVGVGGDGGVYVRGVAQNGNWLGPWLLSATSFAPAGAGVAYGRQGSAQLDAFFVANDGKLYDVWETGDGAWHAPVAVTGALFPAGARITTGMQGANQLDVFAVGSDGAIRVVSAVGTGAWSAVRTVSATGVAPAGAALATGTQGTDQLDVFVVGNDGRLKLYAVTGAGTTWSTPFLLGGTSNAAPPGAPVATGRQGTSQLDAFVVDNTGALIAFGVLDKGPWTGAVGLTAQGFTVKGADVSTSAESSTQLDVFLVSAAGAVSLVFVQNSTAFQGPFSLSAAGVAAPGAKTSAATQWTPTASVTQVDLVTVGKKGLLLSGTSGAGWTPQRPLR